MKPTYICTVRGLLPFITLYLTFDDSRILSPTEWVLNTEAHSVRIWDPATVKKFTDMLQFEDIPTH
jgi:hypothetical protein